MCKLNTSLPGPNSLDPADKLPVQEWSLAGGMPAAMDLTLDARSGAVNPGIGPCSLPVLVC